VYDTLKEADSNESTQNDQGCNMILHFRESVQTENGNTGNHDHHDACEPIHDASDQDLGEMKLL
jgi:hypothetical protein